MLRRALASLHTAALVVQPDIEIAVVVVDDNPDGSARPIVRDAEHQFMRGLHYRHAGAANIAVARNEGLAAAMELADWIAMTDDDQIVSPDWFRALASTQRTTGADAVTGPVRWRVPDGAPSWLRDQPFAELFESEPLPDGAPVDHCLTGNSMIRAAFLREHPSIRFDPRFGRSGGEDMVFYRSAVAAGLDARFSPAAVCEHDLHPDRLTYRSSLRRAWWIGNSGAASDLEIGAASRPRLVGRGGRRVLRGLARPISRVAHRRRAHWRFAGALVAHGLGTLAGAAGVRIRHHPGTG